MASHTQGIQQLLAAEKRAAEKVADAKKRKILMGTRRVRYHRKRSSLVFRIELFLHFLIKSTYVCP